MDFGGHKGPLRSSASAVAAINGDILGARQQPARVGEHFHPPPCLSGWLRLEMRLGVLVLLGMLKQRSFCRWESFLPHPELLF